MTKTLSPSRFAPLLTQDMREVGIEVATEMCERLIAEGAPGLHFITLNFARATREVLARLGIEVPTPVVQPA